MKSFRFFHGHSSEPLFCNSGGSFAPRAEINLTSGGKLSSKGPFPPEGYQMKWPIPRDAKFSPVFQEVRPATVPLHSFCQIFLPICLAWSADKSLPVTLLECMNRAAASTVNPWLAIDLCHLDACSLSISVPLLALANLKPRAKENRYYETFIDRGRYFCGVNSTQLCASTGTA